MPASVIGIATSYGLFGPGFEPGGGEVFRTCPADRPWGLPNLLYSGYRVYPRGKDRAGRNADPLPLLLPWSRKSRSIPLLPLWAYVLYRASLPVQGCTFTFTLCLKLTYRCLYSIAVKLRVFATCFLRLLGNSKRTTVWETVPFVSCGAAAQRGPWPPHS